jgi:hypothetical protein
MEVWQASFPDEAEVLLLATKCYSAIYSESLATRDILHVVESGGSLLQRQIDRLPLSQPLRNFATAALKFKNLRRKLAGPTL